MDVIIVVVVAGVNIVVTKMFWASVLLYWLLLLIYGPIWDTWTLVMHPSDVLVPCEVLSVGAMCESFKHTLLSR